MWWLFLGSDSLSIEMVQKRKAVMKKAVYLLMLTQICFATKTAQTEF